MAMLDGGAPGGEFGPRATVDAAVPQPTPSRDRLAMNKTKTMNAPYLSQHVRFQRLESLHIKNSDPDRAWKSFSTNFARGGINYQGKNWIRDPRSGVWFEDTPKKEFPGLKPAPIGAYVTRYPADNPRAYARMGNGQQIGLEPSVTNGGTVTSLTPGGYISPTLSNASTAASLASTPRAAGRSLTRCSSAPAGDSGTPSKKAAATAWTPPRTPPASPLAGSPGGGSGKKRRAPAICPHVLPGVSMTVYQEY
eukprot:TRINITY_DN100793_c0_g1_i1.p1 TRINITY_DN100793_c0_g1~~TRINITY_DN100793_c0_g1_i1.p1  ORF type:complete len:292 (+),score=49.88 TRINITY_DN100793_c0_g1_i1:126-878(+)